MKMTIIERVSRAISGAPFPSKSSLRKARAAIEAMREPTENMIFAGSQGYDPSLDLGYKEAAGIFQAMIDAALNEGKE